GRGITSTGARDDPNPVHIPRGIMARLAAMPGNQQKTARPLRGRQRDEKTTVFRSERVDPRKSRMRHPGIDDDRIRRLIRAKGKAVCRNHHRLRPREGQIAVRGGGKLRVDLDRGDFSIVAYDLRKNGTVVACAGADVNDVRAWFEIELIIEVRPQAR